MAFRHPVLSHGNVGRFTRQARPLQNLLSGSSTATASELAGQRWLPALMVSWALLQAADVILTYWGLGHPTIHEANPVMAGIIHLPLRVIAIKALLTVGVIALLLRLEARTRYSSLPIILALNLLMAYVFVNNSTLIAAVGGFGEWFRY